MLREHFSLGAGFPRLAIHHTVGRPDSLSNRSVVRRATRIVCRRALCGGSAKLAPKLKYTRLKYPPVDSLPVPGDNSCNPPGDSISGLTPARKGGLSL